MGTIWIGIDDTDSPRGGCTTWVLTELVREARASGVDLVGEPRLVRLNPNIPWKTRGNAALAARFGTGRGPRRRVGEIEGEAVWSYARAGGSPGMDSAWLERMWRRALAASERGSTGTDPAFVAISRPLPERLYWDAVREVVRISSVRRELDRAGAFVRTSGSSRGLVGASAAIAWREPHTTWELLSYRRPDLSGRARHVDRASVRRAQSRHPDLFLCYDERTRRLLVAPHTPCPILYGLRSQRPAAALAARSEVVSEPVDRWLLFRTNQGTGDHLVVRDLSAWGPYRSGIVDATVVAPPALLPGGHVQLSLASADGARAIALAFEPTKTLPAVARALRPGDAVRVWASRGSDPVLRLEGITVRRLVPRSAGRRPPRCPTCDRAANSMGRERGYRCPACRRRWPPEAGRTVATPPPIGLETYHPTPSARRHLAPRPGPVRGRSVPKGF